MNRLAISEQSPEALDELAWNYTKYIGPVAVAGAAIIAGTQETGHYQVAGGIIGGFVIAVSVAGMAVAEHFRGLAADLRS